MVPISPYNHGKPQFQKIQEHKWQFTIDLLNRANKGGDMLRHFTEALKPMEEKIRNCYSETLAFDSDELTEMMVLDGCFIIELFCKYYGQLAGHTNPRHDLLLTEPWVLPSLMRDLTKLKNQIPWFVLKALFDLTVGSWNESHPSLSNLASSFFNCMFQRPDADAEAISTKFSDWEGEHLLNFLRLNINPDSRETIKRPSKHLHLIQLATKLHRARIKNYLSQVFQDVNAYSEKDWRVRWAASRTPTSAHNGLSYQL
ncbi:hypothetical protein NL676_023344 [Syzygium grande]|nr:hypothetical protein NL676_023344 [Syzygium grande]